MIVENRLKEIMDRAGMKDEELAYLSGLTRMTIYHAKSGRGITLLNAQKIARVLRERVSNIWPEEAEEKAA
jgi:DNA-binding XRE family transcriptional regulator